MEIRPNSFVSCFFLVGLLLFISKLLAVNLNDINQIESEIEDLRT